MGRLERLAEPLAHVVAMGVCLVLLLAAIALIGALAALFLQLLYGLEFLEAWLVGTLLTTTGTIAVRFIKDNSAPRES